MIRMFGDVVRGFSLVHDPEGSHYKKKVCLVMTKKGVSGNDTPLCHCSAFLTVIASPFAAAQGRLRRGNLGKPKPKNQRVK